MAEKSQLVSINPRNNNFTCGVVEGFYGRPWTTEQRKDLFQKLKKWGMNSYVYAPKDDYKHRAYWRELYTVEEAEHLTGLITAARENGIAFFYALSPGLDISYSNVKEVAAVKRKLDQVSQFGCSAFALLFDDIEPEMSEADKEVFQSFAHAQVSVSNEVFQHLNQPRFMICPTEYCAARAVPNVSSSEYLNTLGAKLLPDIDIMWTGPKVVSRVLTLESVEEVTDVLRRPPVLWDNLHANDYDQKRVFLGPYSYRSPELILKLRGVMTNPNCEYGANFVGIHTLAQWSRCNVDGKRDLTLNDSVSADIKLETETEDGTGEDIPSNLTPNMYHPRKALHNAINDWLVEFSRPKQAWGPIVKPQPIIPVPIPVPILPSINTCMSLTTTTTTTTSSSSSTILTTPSPQISSAIAAPISSTPIILSDSLPSVISHGVNQLEALAEVCSAVTNAAESVPLQPVAAPVMNSLASESKIVALPPMPTPLPLPLTVSLASVPSVAIPLPLPLPLAGSTSAEPMDCNPTPNGSPAHLGKTAASSTEDVAMAENGSCTMAGAVNSSSTTMQVETTESNSHFQNSSSTMIVESQTEDETNVTNNYSNTETTVAEESMLYEDVALLCDLFYLPFEHGSGAIQLLHEFNWCKSHAHVIGRDSSSNEFSRDDAEGNIKDPQVQEWFERAAKLDDMTKAVNRLFKRLTLCPNRELLHELYPYVWDIRGIVSLLNSYVKWLGSSNFPQTIGNYTLGSFTWFSKGWKETFMSGEHEPWVFRGGLTADLQRLVPVDSSTDLFVYKVPEVPSNKIYDIRQTVLPADEHSIKSVCRLSCAPPNAEVDLSPELVADRFLGLFLEGDPAICFVVEDETDIVGYVSAVLDAKQLYSRMKTDFIPKMQVKHPLPESISEPPSIAQDMISWFHTYENSVPEQVLLSHPSVMCCAVLPSVQDQSVMKRLVTCSFAALRANGSFGVHSIVRSNDQLTLELFSRLGFLDLNPGVVSPITVLGRAF